MSEVRSVNGWGPRCGCGGESVLHYKASAFYDPVSPDTSTFLCLRCAVDAVEAFRSEHPTRPPYWPGDENRDEPYVAPTERRTQPHA